jgi:hypothetical protein
MSGSRRRTIQNMPSNTVAVPERAALRPLFDAAVSELNPSRKAILTNDFYVKTSGTVFEAGYTALSDTVSGASRMHAVSAPAGAGKTTFAYALIAAVTRYAENRPDAPYGAVFVVDQIERADEIYRDLIALLPGKVAIWTRDHDRNCTQPQKVLEPAARFAPEELRHFPVIVVTHKFYLGARGHNAVSVWRNDLRCERVLTIVDERPDEAPSIDVLLSEAQGVREALIEQCPETKEYLDALLHFMESYSYAEANKLYRPGLEVDTDKVSAELWWFQTDAAQRLVKSSGIPNAEKLFAFAKALAVGRACVATSGSLARFFGYDEQRIIDRSTAAVLLDATADIDGISRIVPWRVHAETPTARYDNLDIVHVRQHTKKRLTEYLKTASNQRAYVDWMVATIRENMEPGEKGLVICKKILFDQERIPQWPDGDTRFKSPKIYTEEYGWGLDGRKLCATHWGTGVGRNIWKDADVVLLFDEFILPRRISVATTQGYRGHKVHEGDLGRMKSLNSKAEGVDLIADGHVLRWTKQLALRGRARFYDANGVCGKQRLVIGSDVKRFMVNARRLFPGAKIKTVGDYSDNGPWKSRILGVLSNSKAPTVTTRALSRIIKRPWREVSRNVVTPDFESVITGLGWRYVSKKGRGGSRFERIGAHEDGGLPKSTLVANADTVVTSVI